MSARSPWMALMFAVVSTAPLAAQETPEPLPITLPAGARARLSSTALRGYFHGFVLRNDARSVTFLLESGGEQTLAVSSLTHLDISVSKRRQTLKGALIGAAAGAALGLLFNVDPNTCDLSDSTAFCTRGEAVGGGALVGVLAGGVAGFLTQTEQWTPVDLAAWGRQAAPVSRKRERGPAFRVAVRF